MKGRERKLLRAAIRTCYEALADVQAGAASDQAATPAVLARALRAVLEGQIAILEALIGEIPGGDSSAPEQPEGASREALPAGPPAPATPAAGIGSEKPPQTEIDSPAAGAPAGAPAASRDPLVRAAFAAFAIEDMNRWLASGTVFQIRGALAFLNMNSMGGAKVDEMRGHILKMGFSEDLGQLEAPGVAGAVMLFRRP